MTSEPDTLADYPYVVLRTRCDHCGRANAYRLARVAQAFGANMPMAEVLTRLFGDCPFALDRRPAHRDATRCLGYFPDLAGPRRPPDLPPPLMRWSVIDGGKTRRSR
jgi:hypothetical protein